LRSTPRLSAISFFDRPACQCIKISVTSITSNVLLAIGLPPSSRTGGRLLLLDGQVHHDTHAIPKGNYVSAAGNYVSVSPSDLGNYVSADTSSGTAQGITAAVPRLIVAGYRFVRLSDELR
jgi:hypothetical protein